MSMRSLGTLACVWLFGTAFMWTQEPAAVAVALVAAMAGMVLWPLSIFRPGLRSIIVLLGFAVLLSSGLFADSFASLANNVVTSIAFIATGLAPAGKNHETGGDLESGAHANQPPHIAAA